MSGYISINDPAFDRPVSLRDAYRIMEHFVLAHIARGEVETGTFHAYFGLEADGRGGDPAALYDYLESAAAVLGAGRSADALEVPGAPTEPPAA